MEPPPGCLESPFGAAPPAHLLEGNILVGVGAHSALIPGHLLSLETARQPGTWRESAVRFPAQQVWILRAGQSLWSGGAWESANTGGHRELINWASPGKFGRSTPAHGLSSSKTHPGQNHPTSHPNSWRRGFRRVRGSARRIQRVPDPGGEAPPAPVCNPGRRPNCIGRGRGRSRWAGAGYTKTAAEAPGLRSRPICGRPNLPSRRGRSAGAACPPALSRLTRRRPPPPARGPLLNPCPPTRPLIGGGGAPGQRGPPHLPRPLPLLPHCRLFPTPPGPPPASQPCKSREETRGFTSVFTPITTNPDRTDPD